MQFILHSLQTILCTIDTDYIQHNGTAFKKFHILETDMQATSCVLCGIHIVTTKLLKGDCCSFILNTLEVLYLVTC